MNDRKTPIYPFEPDRVGAARIRRITEAFDIIAFWIEHESCMIGIALNQAPHLTARLSQERAIGKRRRPLATAPETRGGF